MINTRTTLLLAFTVTLLATSCKKYDDGPMFSLRSKTERISNTWRVDKATNGGNDVTSSFDQYELQLLSNGDATLAALYSLGSLSFEFETTGTWSFEDSKEDLRLDFENDAADRTYEILRLKEDELWLQDNGGGLELHLVSR
ncbi:MAG: hypothetical protein IPI00_15500 [Flavobacteriales bacterium]|nr:hypothetical protein [Flavobacteriales bacterium]MBK6945412.1 hypothetical protein [Flavobacteriales bacterium]MBK7241528.1 hypothetical protein [Flavobacteriales bacterium]MBK7298357.1 hypothetical protein [Flavobacteriales bacterium]MBK9535030.1 hypothetical protein [Flavobacteriales bacterium]